ncbi:MAG: hypothetical protein M1511_13690 [Deltaproteobacteria bacterium]|nr:hypothetical protein [Deltaproteobacteria bacterium]
MTELVLVAGAVEMMIVDYQCIMPAVSRVASCYHTKMVSNSDRARFPGMGHHEFSPENVRSRAYDLVKIAAENFARRDPAKVFIPVNPQEVIGGMSVEAILRALGGSAGPLVQGHQGWQDSWGSRHSRL